MAYNAIIPASTIAALAPILGRYSNTESNIPTSFLLTTDLTGVEDGRLFEYYLSWSDQQNLRKIYYGRGSSNHDIPLSVGDKRINFRLCPPALGILFDAVRGVIAGETPEDIIVVVILSYLQPPDYQGNIGNAMGSPTNPGNDG